MPTIQEYFTYIASNCRHTVLYVGMAVNLVKRMHEHKTGKFENSFSKKYNICELMYFERLNNKHEAAHREKELKGWTRTKKINIIKTINPDFKDISTQWFDYKKRDSYLKSSL